MVISSLAEELRTEEVAVEADLAMRAADEERLVVTSEAVEEPTASRVDITMVES